MSSQVLVHCIAHLHTRVPPSITRSPGTKTTALTVSTNSRWATSHRWKCVLQLTYARWRERERSVFPNTVNENYHHSWAITNCHDTTARMWRMHMLTVRKLPRTISAQKLNDSTSGRPFFWDSNEPPIHVVYTYLVHPPIDPFHDNVGINSLFFRLLWNDA